ncbi:SGNH/GDSL hydrolase family protein [Nocardioides sp. MAH-18]|uniref:SGNH/GDSL hydrolase family protein n=1 Tax=Nocardioides agri TaxID=2682843 RepID=A0A6L6XW97_9ACTN|nr:MULTISPECIES: SGNH/GDSL hydrolase family protein [unclassified Nocardioides]MBA2955897.1 SGNH/GDSL hydrolase family protein [Nocardioides sp. CGMCC 1.13656]MVQ50746.1 SGNH/GDSL hydrolase family protein [Nocardioides sp. MAH-18]
MTSSLARATRTASVVLTAVVTVAASVAGSTTAAAGPPDPIVYDALGDSYASGFGVPPYTPTCGRSDAAYPVQLDGRKHIALDDFVACGGATTLTVVSGGQLAALDAQTDLLTLSAGGNDTGWSTAVVACLLGGDETCTQASDAVTARITTLLPARLDRLYAQVAAAAPNAHVVVTGYARLFSPEYGAYLGASPAEQQTLNEGADLLNATIARAAAAHGFQFVDVTKRFLDHGVNAPDPWILGLSDPGAFHPNADGYETYTAAVTSAVNPSRLRS